VPVNSPCHRNLSRRRELLGAVELEVGLSLSFPVVKTDEAQGKVQADRHKTESLWQTISCVRNQDEDRAASDLAVWVNSRGRDVLNFYDDCDVRAPQKMPISSGQQGNISAVIAVRSVSAFVSLQRRNSGLRSVV